MSAIRFVLLGGFLGSGKTTTLLRLARHYVAAGKRVGIIANDQAENLVDSETFRAAGPPDRGSPLAAVSAAASTSCSRPPAD